MTTQKALLAWGLSLLLVVPMSHAAGKDSRSTPWLVPPHILEFTGAMNQLFGTNQSFGARVSITELPELKGSKPAGGLLLFRDGNSIFEPDSAPVKALKTRKKEQDGDFGFLIVSLPEKGLSYVVSEGVSGYTEVPLPKESRGHFAVESKLLGRERMQGFDCEKRLVAVAPENGEAQSFVVWNAIRLRNFPVRIERKKGGPALQISFSEIRFERPDDSLFASPSGYQHYESLNAMTEEMTRRVWNVYRRPDESIAFPPSTVRPGSGSARPLGY